MSFRVLETTAMMRREYLPVLQHQHDLIDLTLHQLRANRAGRRGRERRRRYWVRPWIGRRCHYGIYDQLMAELRNEDEASFTNFLRMPPAMFDELLTRVGPRITKQQTFYRDPLEPGMRLALTLRHLASGSKYASMKFGWRVPHNTQSLVVRQVCQAIIDEYVDEVLVCPTTPDGWRAIADKFYQRWNFPHTCGALDGKHVACRCPPKSGSQYYNYKGFYSIVLLALVDADYKFIWADVGGTGSASDAQIYNDSELREPGRAVLFRRWRCVCSAAIHDEAIQPPGYDQWATYLQLQAQPSKEGSGKCIWHFGDKIPGSAYYNAAKTRDHQADCENLRGPTQPPENQVILVLHSIYYNL